MGCATSSTNVADNEVVVETLSDEEVAKMRKKAGRRGRRVSVSAEAGADDDSDFQPREVPKTDEQRQRIEQVVRGVFLFQGLTPAELQQVIGAMEEVPVANGHEIIKQGAQGDFFYIVDSGEFDVYVAGVNDGKPVFHYKPGGSFGELALMYNAPRAATVTACSEAVVWAVDRQTFRHVVIKSRAKRAEKFAKFLSNVPLLAKITDEERGQLADHLILQEYKNGEVVVTQGDQNFDAFKFYFVMEGKAVANIDKNGTTAKVADLKEGDYFGEKALIEHQPRAATISAEGPLTCASMDFQTFERLMGSCRDIMERHQADYARATEKAFEGGGESKQ